MAWVWPLYVVWASHSMAAGFQEDLSQEAYMESADLKICFRNARIYFLLQITHGQVHGSDSMGRELDIL